MSRIEVRSTRDVPLGGLRAMTVRRTVPPWVVLPAEHRHAGRAFQHHEPMPVRLTGATVRVFLGTMVGDTSPVATFTPLLGAEILLDAQTTLDLDVAPGFEHGVLVDTAVARVGNWAVERGEMGYQARGSST